MPVGHHLGDHHVYALERADRRQRLRRSRSRCSSAREPQPGQLSNTASLQAPSDGNPDNDSFTDAGAVSEPAIDLHVEKVVTSTPNFTPIGYLFLDPVTYRIEVTNNGVADAANVARNVRHATDGRVDHYLAGVVSRARSATWARSLQVRRR